MEDLAVIRRVKGGDIDAFSVLVEKYHRRLLNFIFQITRDSNLVEDIGQDVFFSIYKSIKNFDESRGTPFSAWLFIAARNRCIAELRKRGKNESIALDEVGELRCRAETAEETLLGRERELALEASMAQLPEPFRSVIMRSLHGDSPDQIATAEGIPPGTVKSRLFRARERMKELVKCYLMGENDARI
ncbi:MAG: sigma-70 family RNA polymerase sigma factor [Deltaproteobacteria bacterium]|nr:sigma-70 family RNA polymerase sigma factor [Deltaproteobacteria bacterium]MBF0527524.1 sigma-70 family RNA polymerase sigma factor [Deltaproteobacteria bacterium]